MSLQALRLAGKFTTAHTTSKNPGMSQAWHLTQVKFSLECGCNGQELWTRMNSKNIPPDLWLWASLLACTALASAHRVWVILDTGLHRVLPNIQVYSSRSVWGISDLGNCFTYLYRKGLVSKLESELKFSHFQVSWALYRLIFLTQVNMGT